MACSSTSTSLAGRAKALREHAEQARASKELATMRRDLELDVDPAALVLAPPDRSQLKEIFRRFEFRNLLGRVDDLDEALPAAAVEVTGVDVPWREGELEQVTSPQRWRSRATASRWRATGGGRGRAWSPESAARLRDAALVVHDAKAARLEAHDDTLLMAYLIDPGRSSYLLDDLAAEYGVELVPEPAADEETAALVRQTAAVLRLEPQLRARIAERGLDPLYRNVELPLSAVLAAMEDVGVRIDTYRMGEITARLAERVEELEARAHELAGEEFMLGSTQQVARVLFEVLGLTAGRKARPATRPTPACCARSGRARDRRRHRGVARVLEAPEHIPRAAAEPDLAGRGRSAAHPLQPGRRLHGAAFDLEPNLQAIPIRTELGREIRSAFVAEPGFRLLSADYSQVELRILAHVSGEPKLREAFAAGEDIHGHRRRGARQGALGALTKDERNVAKMVNFGIIYGISAFGLSETSTSRARKLRPTSTRTSRASRTSRTSSSGRSSRPSATATRRRSSAGAGRVRS